MFKKSLWLLLIVTPVLVSAQDKLDKLKAPSSPGASVLGIQPSVILTPKSYESLEATLFSNYLDNSGGLVIPNDLGLEFSPYWMTDHKIKTESYLLPTIGQSLIRNLSFSVASSNTFSQDDSIGSGAIGIGIRTSIQFTDDKTEKYILAKLDTLREFNGLAEFVNHFSNWILLEPIPEMQKMTFLTILLDTLEMKNKTLKFFESQSSCRIILSDLALFLAEELPEYSPEKNDDFIDSVNRIVERYWYLPEQYENLKKIASQRPGFRLDFAGAFALNFPTNEFDYSYIPKNSFWLTLSYSFKSNNPMFFKLLAVVNYNWYGNNFYETYFPEQKFYDYTWDYGMGLNFNYRKFSAQLEAVGRYGKVIIDQSTDEQRVTTSSFTEETDFQYIGNFSYQISDGLVVTYSIGNRFKPVVYYSGTLVNTLSLNFGFGGPTAKDLK